MSKTAIHSIVGTAHWEPKYPFDLVVAYEDTTTRNRAMQLYDHLAQELLDDYDFQCSWWKLDHLDNPGICEQAADAAAEANMIIVSLRGDQGLPTVFHRWLEGWLSRRGDQKSALVLLLGDNGERRDQPRRLRLQLQQAARQARMDFFVHAYDLPETGTPYATESRAPQAQRANPVPEEVLDPPAYIPRWGINE